MTVVNVLKNVEIVRIVEKDVIGNYGFLKKEY